MGFGAGDIKDKFRTYDGDADKRLRKKLEKSGKFDESFKTPVRIEKINVEVMGRWVAERLAELLGFEDDVLSELVMNMLAQTRDAKTGQDKRVDPQQLQVQLTGFLNKQAQPFVAELWKLLLDAQDAPHGIPRAFVERKKQELVARREASGDADGRRGDDKRGDRSRSRSRERDRGGRDRDRGRDREAAQRSVVRAASNRGRSRSRSRERRKKRSGFSSAPAPAFAPPKEEPPPGKPALPAPWRWKESRSTPGDYYCVNEKTGERRWQAPSHEKPKKSDDKITVVHCLIKHADSRRPSSHRTKVISLAKSDARNEADALRKRVAASSDMEAALSDEASKRSDCPSSTNGGRLKPFQRGDLERAFEAAAFRLAVGELSPVVETAAGFHVIRRIS